MLERRYARRIKQISRLTFAHKLTHSNNNNNQLTQGLQGFLSYLKSQGLPHPFLFDEKVFDGTDLQRNAAVVADTLLFLRTWYEMQQGMYPDVGESASLCTVRFRSIDVPCRVPLSHAWDPESVAGLMTATKSEPGSVDSNRSMRLRNRAVDLLVDRVWTVLCSVHSAEKISDKTRLSEEIAPVVRDVLLDMKADFEDHMRASRRYRMSVESQLSEARRELQSRRASASPGEICISPASTASPLNSNVRSPPVSPSAAEAREREMQYNLAAKTAELEASQALCKQKDEDIVALRERCDNLSKNLRRCRLELQDLKGAVRVFARVRPTAEQTCINVLDDSELCLWLPQTAGVQTPRRSNENKEHRCKYDACYGPSASNKDVADEVIPLALGVLDGYSAVVLAYGQTGSGKTFTMLGEAYTSSDDAVLRNASSGSARFAESVRRASEMAKGGVIGHSLAALFNEIKDRNRTTSWTYEVGIEIIEIYNDRAVDLLGNAAVDIQTARSTTDLGGAPNATKRQVRSQADALAAIAEGFAKRSTGSTNMNAASSRSHLVVTCHVTGHIHADGHGEPVKSMHARLQLCDLAGSERVERSKAEGDRFKEACAINRSLSSLGTVLHSLQTGDAHVPYRNSKLTELLSGALQKGGCRAVMLIHVAPETASANESLSTLQFGTRASRVMLGKTVKLEASGDAKREITQERERRLAAEQALKQATSKFDRNQATELADLRAALANEQNKRVHAEQLAKLAAVKADKMESDMTSMMRRNALTNAARAGLDHGASPAVNHGKENQGGQSFEATTPRSARRPASAMASPARSTTLTTPQSEPFSADKRRAQSALRRSENNERNELTTLSATRRRAAGPLTPGSATWRGGGGSISSASPFRRTSLTQGWK